jgi:DNA-binding transcriptional MocR family regulator
MSTPSYPSILAEYESIKAQDPKLKLDLTRGKPSAAQVDLSLDLLSLPGPTDYFAEGKLDVRNYGGLEGLAEARSLFAPMMGAPADEVLVSDNSSLSLMHDSVLFALYKGVCDGDEPWMKADEPAFICPVPGYDRHFRICQDLGIRMISVPMLEDGPNMDEVEQLVASDAQIKGMWCIPKYNNPTGTVFSDSVIERLAAMPTAASDFRLFWDNAYCVHHLTEEKIGIANILELSAKHGHANRPFVFASTSKITMPGAGLSMFASSPANIKWFLDRITPRTIGPDKVNHLRHVRFLEDDAGIHAHMDKHRALIAPKFETVLSVFSERLSDVEGVSWTKPKGGYFISLEVPLGCAKRVIALAKDAGVSLTPAGSTHPYGVDPDDRTIRIAPTFPKLEEVRQATEVVAVCVLLAALEEK